MRGVLTLLAVALVALLTVALVAPLFIDWSAHRAEIEAQIGALTGGRVRLSGQITLRLLPIPYLELGEGSTAGPRPDDPRLSFKSAQLELALVKLASGAIRFTEIRLERPVLTLTRGANGSLNLPETRTREADVVGFDRLVAHSGEVQILSRDAEKAWTIGGVDFEADAPSLAGPYRLSGKFNGPGGSPVVFRFASEKGDAAETPIHIALDAGPCWPSLVFDGALALAAGAKAPNVSGLATLTGSVVSPDGPLPWRVTGPMSADLDAVNLKNAGLQFGPEERAVRVQGDAMLGYGSSPRLSIRAKAKQANVDALLRRKGEDGVPPARAVRILARSLAPALSGIGGLTVEAHVAMGDVILGSETMSDLSATVKAAPGSPVMTWLDIGLPGRSRFKADGEFETGPAPKFDGAIDFSTDDLPRLGGWASRSAGEFAARAASLGDTFAIRGVSLSGDVEVSSVGFSGRKLRLALERSILTGSLAFTGRVGSEPGRLYMDLASDSLDVETLPTLSASASLLGDLDLSIALRAKSLHVSHVGETDSEVDSGSLALKVDKSGPTTKLEQLSVADLGGASVDAQGSLGPEGMEATGHLRAAKLRDFALLVSRLAPGEWSKTLAERASLLSPTSLGFELHGGSGSDGGPAINSLRANGTIGQTHAALAVDPAPNVKGQTVAVDLDAPDAGAFLRQLGFVGSAVPSGKAHIALHATGAWGAGYDVEATGVLSGADVSATGRFAPTAEGDEARLFGSAKLKSGNVVPLASALGLAPPGGVIGPVEASTDLTLRGERWTISRLSGTIAGVKTSGELAYEPPPEAAETLLPNPDVALAEEAVNGPAATATEAAPPALTGELSFDRLPLGAVLALALGPPQPAKASAVWSDAKFGALPLIPPSASVRIGAPTIEAADGFSAQGFSATLRLDKGRLDLNDMAMKIAGGTASGSVTFRRDRDSATLNGTMSGERLAIGRAGLSGRIGGTIQFASTGKSPAALIAGLAGGGEANLAGVEFARTDLAALDRVVARSQAQDAQLDETNIAYAFGQELDKAPLRLPDGGTPLSLSAGTLKLGPLSIARPRGEAKLSASLDLARLSLETRLELTSPSTDLKFWSGPPPTATVTVENALSAPKRQVEVASLAAALATQAIARETDRISNLKSDIRERTFFNRRLKGERFMDRRDAEIEEWRAEQARLKALAQRQEAEKAAEKAAADKSAAERVEAARAAEKAESAKPFPQPELPPDISRAPASADADLAPSHPRPATPLPPTRPKPRPAPERASPSVPRAGGLY